MNAGLDAGAVSSIGHSDRASKLFRSIAPSDHLQAVKLTGGRSATELAMMDAFKRREGKKIAVGFSGANHGQGLAMT